jgi:hypothetical protein
MQKVHLRLALAAILRLALTKCDSFILLLVRKGAFLLERFPQNFGRDWGTAALTAEEFENLPLEVRLLRFHECYEEALQSAARATNPADKAKYMAMAADWQTLAKETERLLRESRSS